jgi:biofilm PGA synthesis N-glycosyltransferase PgaC
MRRRLVEPLPPDTLADDAVIPLRGYLRGYRVIFDPEAVAFDYPTPHGQEFRRRMRTLAGMWQVYARLPQLFTKGNRMRLHFLSHKFSRLMLPWVILVAIGATVALPPSWIRTFLLVDEFLLFFLAAVDAFVPLGFPLKRITSPARTFLTMNAAAMLSVMVFFVPAATFWRTSPIRRPEEAKTAVRR